MGRGQVVRSGAYASSPMAAVKLGTLPAREGRDDIPQEALEVGGQVSELVESQCIEFTELLTPDKYQK